MTEASAFTVPLTKGEIDIAAVPANLAAVLYNKTDGALTHLLEHGHALRQGGRSPAIVHIQPVEDLLYGSIRSEDLA